MADPMETRSEKYLRFSRRRKTVTLLVIIAVGGVCLAMAIHPNAPQWPRAVPALWIVAVIIAAGLQRTLGGERWDPGAPEARAIKEDEWRRSNMERARRIAFVVVLGAQLPLGLLLARLAARAAAFAPGGHGDGRSDDHPRTIDVYRAFPLLRSGRGRCRMRC